jgi:ATP-dependent Lon protease
LIPEENIKDITEMPDNIKNKIEIVPVKWIDQVLALALERVPEALPELTAENSAAPANTETATAKATLTH